jgi:hypothetical protein
MTSFHDLIVRNASDECDMIVVKYYVVPIYRKVKVEKDFTGILPQPSMYCHLEIVSL